MHKANDVALYRAPGGNPASITARGILCDWPRRRACAEMPTRVEELIPLPLKGGASYLTPPPLRGGAPYFTPPPLRGGAPYLTPPPLRGGAPYFTPPPLRGGAPYFTPPPLRGGGWEGGDLSSAIQSDTGKGLAALSPPPRPSPLKGEGKTEPSSPLKGEGKQRHPPSSKETGHEQWLPISWIPDVRRSLHG